MKKNQPLGFLTPSGLIAAGVTILIVVGIVLARGGVLFSPGPLNAKTGDPLGGYTSHAEIDGECGVCHVPFWGTQTMTDRCLACHTDIVNQLSNPDSLHGILLGNNPSLACRVCHLDHRGADAPLTIPVDFPHQLLGYSLAAHQYLSDGTLFSCSDCHIQGYSGQFDQNVCTDCHRQIKASFMESHLQTYGNGCLGCHDGIDTYGQKFDHNLVAFQLTGKHAPIECSECHMGARSMADLKATPQECVSCHEQDNPHSDALGTACVACHTTAGWLPAKFDHNLTVFKLEGKHVEVPCENCHIDNVFWGTPTDCYSCHQQDDAHGGQFGTACAICHNPSGWLPASFDHNLYSFQLIGKHIDVPCTNCHVNNVYKGTPSDCYACHAGDDKHGGLYGTACGLCHTPDGWLPAFFDHSGFPLTGGHAGLPCTRCHKGGSFQISTSCASCHAEPAYHFGLFGLDGAQCHTTSNWSATYTGPHPGGCDGNCISHEGASCRDCHTSTLSSATCTKCHNSNNPGDGGGGGGDD